MICEDCRFAVWSTSKNGSLHPSGKGVCIWQKTFRIAGSARKDGDTVSKIGDPITIMGGGICRHKDRSFPKKCSVFQRKGTNKLVT